jgi:hypothetical protein
MINTPTSKPAEKIVDEAHAKIERLRELGK